MPFYPLLLLLSLLFYSTVAWKEPVARRFAPTLPIPLRMLIWLSPALRFNVRWHSARLDFRIFYWRPATGTLQRHSNVAPIFLKFWKQLHPTRPPVNLSFLDLTRPFFSAGFVGNTDGVAGSTAPEGDQIRSRACLLLQCVFAEGIFLWSLRQRPWNAEDHLPVWHEHNVSGEWNTPIFIVITHPALRGRIFHVIKGVQRSGNRGKVREFNFLENIREFN